MPWSAGVYTRTNGQFNGPTVWNSDKDNAIKIESARHDTHDQDIANGITACLNINGENSMNVDLNMGSHKVVNLTDGTANADAVNFSQLDSKLNISSSITAHAWSGNTFTSSRADGDLTTDIKMFDEFKSNGPIRHLLDDQGSGNAAIDVNAYNRHRVDNNGALTLTFSNLPSGDDTDLGAYWQAEGQVIVFNGGSPGAITIAGIIPNVVIGSASEVSGAGSILTYICQWLNGSLNSMLVWSAE